MVAGRRRALIKFCFWVLMTVLVFGYAIHFYRSGTMVHWYYYKAKADGFAVNTKAFANASPEKPASLQIGAFTKLDGLQTVRVKKGDILPEQTTGVIDLKTVEEGKRVRLDGGALTVLIPWQIKEAKGFKYKDSFTHKQIRTNPLSGVWNLVMVGLIGLCLGYLAEGFTDLIGLKFQKIEHSVGH
jgi:hypothetical protein